jgi:hypothetical protein
MDLREIPGEEGRGQGAMSDMRSSKELVKSLRDYSEGPTFYWGPICQKAAEEIERLQRELAASAAQYQEACDDANRFARERDEARASSEPRGIREALQSAADALRNMGCAFDADEAEEALRATPPPSAEVSSESAWLVENGKHDTQYRYFDETGLVGWTPDVNHAIRFSRRIDAERFAAADEEAWRIAEHMWCSVPTPKCSCRAQSEDPKMHRFDCDFAARAAVTKEAGQ